MMLMNEYDLDAMDPFGCSLPGSDVFEYLEEVGHGRYSEVRCFVQRLSKRWIILHILNRYKRIYRYTRLEGEMMARSLR